MEKWRKIGSGWVCRLTAVAVACVFIVAGLPGGGVRTKEERGREPRLRKIARSIDQAVGILDAGKLQHAVYNDGYLANWDYIPQLHAAFYKGYGYIPELSMMIGVPPGPWTPAIGPTGDSLVTGYSVSAGNVGGDWGPTAGSKGRYHSGDVVVDDVVQGSPLGNLPLMATSTLPASWPTRWYGPDGLSGSVPDSLHPGSEVDGVWHFWPGPWAVDPTTGQVLLGSFTSDRDVFFSINDFDLDDRGLVYAERDDQSDQGYSLGIQLDITAHGYGRSFAEDFIFFPMKIINKSKNDYTGMYVGFYLDVDAPSYNLSGFGPHDNADWMKFLKSETVQHPTDPSRDTTYFYNMAYIFDFGLPDNPDPAKPSVPAYTAIKLLRTPKNPAGVELGLTDWHWFEYGERVGVIHSNRREIIQYKVMSGDNTGMTAAEDAAYFHPDPAGNLDPHFDSPESIALNNPTGLDCVFLMSSGPFDLAAGDTTEFSFALIMGDNDEDLKRNARVAQLMFDNNYLGADPPRAPNVTAVPGDGKVILYWDDVAEPSRDILTTALDFEGYKIYRTTSDPRNNQWGEVIKDGLGNEVGFVPVAQYDLRNNVSGIDPNYPHLDLGSNTGLAHSWTDNTVNNGVTYWYSVVAYDRGISLARGDPLALAGWADLNSLENAKGNNPGAVPNLVEVVPNRKPLGYEPPKLLPIYPDPDSLSKGGIEARILDPDKVTKTHTYTISFDDTSNPGTLLYSVKDDAGTTLVNRSDRTHKDDGGPVFDGLRLIIDQYDEIEYRDQEWIHLEAEQSNFSFGALVPGTSVRAADYVLQFYDPGGVLRLGVRAFNIMDDPSKTAPVLETVVDISPSSGQKVLEFREPQGASTVLTWRTTMSWSVTTVPIDTVIVGTDTTVYYQSVLARPPSPGDELLMKTTKPLTSRDQFQFAVEAFQQRQRVEASEMSRIKVVPNPYVVTAEWEFSPNLRKLAFTNLPPTCDIFIYTVAGEVVRQIERNSATTGTEFWNLLNKSNQSVAYGLYIYVVETPDGQRTTGKFVLIR